mgnify:CR=1 FL=1
MLTLLVFPLYGQTLEYVIEKGDFWANLGTDPIKIKRDHVVINPRIMKGYGVHQRLEWKKSYIKYYALFSQNPFNNTDNYDFDNLFTPWYSIP